MKYQGVFVLIVCCVLALGVMAQQAEETPTPEEETPVEASVETTDDKVPADSDEVESASDADDTDVSKASTVSKAPRKYPVAAGVWYPGEPVPTEASRYYRVRCWPGCHSYGEWTGPAKPKQASPDSEE